MGNMDRQGREKEQGANATDVGGNHGRIKYPIHIQLQDIDAEPSDDEDDTTILDSGAYFQRLVSSARPSSASSSASAASVQRDANGHYTRRGFHNDQNTPTTQKTARYEEGMKSQNQENDPESQFSRHRYGTMKALQHQHRRLLRDDQENGKNELTNNDEVVGAYSPVPPSRVASTGVLTPTNATRQNTYSVTRETDQTESHHNMLFSTFSAPTTGTSRENTKTRVWAYISASYGETRGFEAITPATLAQLTGIQDLETVQKIQIGINTSDISASALGEYLPNLRSLTLDGSVMSSIRDLGTKLRNLRVLSIAHCGLTDLDGICALESLEELYAPSNHIGDAAPLALHDQLRILDLSDNEIRGVDQLSNLCSCPKLERLTLKGNPVAFYDSYRRLARHFLPNIVTLDGLEYDSNDKRPPSVGELTGEDEFSAGSDIGTHEQLISSQSSLQGASHEESVSSSIFEEERDDIMHSSKTSFRVRSAESGAGSSLSKSMQNESPKRPHTTGNLNNSIGVIPTEPKTSREHRCDDHRNEKQQGESREASGLTHGTNTVFAGNPVMAMRRRKQSGEDSNKSSNTSVLAVLDELRLEDTNNKEKRKIASRETSRSSGASETKDPSTTTNVDEGHNDRSSDDNTNCTHASSFDEGTIVTMLRQRPKDVPQLKSRETFRQFFKGMSKSYLSRLLREAFAPLGVDEMKKKEEKRLELLSPVLDDS